MVKQKYPKNLSSRPVTVALAGNPNSGKSTLFNLLTGGNQSIGNWPGVTVERKEGRLRGFSGVTIQDLPGIYSLSPYSPEERITRRYLLEDKPSVIFNIVDANHLERNLYLTTQLLETGIPVVVVLTMNDVLQKSGDSIDGERLEALLGCRVIPAFLLYGSEGAQALMGVLAEAQSSQIRGAPRMFSGGVEQTLRCIADLYADRLPAAHRRFYAVKLFERDSELLRHFDREKEKCIAMEPLIADCEKQHGDDAESIIAFYRYIFAERIRSECLHSTRKGSHASAEGFDRIATGRFTAFPLFAALMFLVYYLSVGSVGAFLSDMLKNVLFGPGLLEASGAFFASLDIPLWLSGLAIDGIVASVASVLGFVPQMLILFILLSFLEESGYMTRVAFIMDALLRRFGLSGKSFIPLMIGSACSVPAVMAARTIESPGERRMTASLLPFVPCGAKMPLVALIASALFDGAWWVAASAYFMGLAAVMLSGLLLKKTRFFAGEPSPFVMELPPYRLPLLRHIWRNAGGRVLSFVYRAGTVILLAGIAVWFLANFRITGGLVMSGQMGDSMLASFGRLLAPLFRPLGFGFWETAVATLMGLFAKEEIVAVLAVLQPDTGMFLTESLGGLGAFCFLMFNLLCAPCFATLYAIRRETGSILRMAGAAAYQCAFAYGAAFITRQLGLLFGGAGFDVLTAAAWILLGLVLYLIARPVPTRDGTLKKHASMI